MEQNFNTSNVTIQPDGKVIIETGLDNFNTSNVTIQPYHLYQRFKVIVFQYI